MRFLTTQIKKGDVELREGYIGYTAKIWDIRLGRQIITWGIGDLIFINDVFSKGNVYLQMRYEFLEAKDSK